MLIGDTHISRHFPFKVDASADHKLDRFGCAEQRGATGTG